GGVFFLKKRNMAEGYSVRRRAIRTPRGPATICARRSVFLNKSKPGGKPIRIVAGQYRRTPIAVPDVPGLRPTPDRVRETLFNWVNHLWGGEFAGKRVLDLFAGSGALGFEARSEEHTSELQSRENLVCRLLLEKKKNK